MWTSRKTAFVLGNGTSRQGLDLEKLSRLGPVYGCNALYRDFVPELLVATDQPIASAIEQSGYPKKHRFITRRPTPGSGAEKIQHNYNWSSGPIALTYACLEGADQIFLLGFDLTGIAGGFNNVYADTEFYKKSSESETYSGNWIAQIASVISDYQHVRFIRVINENLTIPAQFQKLKNLRHIGVSDFVSGINTQ